MNAQSPIQYAFKGGGNVGLLKGYDDNSVYTINWQQQVGFHAGVFARIPVTSVFTIQPELLYSTKGASATYIIPTIFRGIGTYQLAYTELPLLFTVRLSEWVELQAGPYAAYLIAANSITGGLFQYPNMLSRNSFKTFDYGAAGGINFLWRQLIIGVRYTQGLHQVGTDSIFSNTLLGSSENTVGMLSIGYFLK